MPAPPHTPVSADPSQCRNAIVFVSPGSPDILAAIRFIFFSIRRRVPENRRTRESAGANRRPSLDGVVLERNSSVIDKKGFTCPAKSSCSCHRETLSLVPVVTPDRDGGPGVRAERLYSPDVTMGNVPCWRAIIGSQLLALSGKIAKAALQGKPKRSGVMMCRITAILTVIACWIIHKTFVWQYLAH